MLYDLYQTIAIIIIIIIRLLLLKTIDIIIVL